MTQAQVQAQAKEHEFCENKNERKQSNEIFSRKYYVFVHLTEGIKESIGSYLCDCNIKQFDFCMNFKKKKNSENEGKIYISELVLFYASPFSRATRA